MVTPFLFSALVHSAKVNSPTPKARYAHNFHQMTSLQCDKSLINLEGKSVVQLGIDLLGQRYTMDTICYYDINTDYKPLPQVMPEDCARMAMAFLLYILEVYLFANGG